MLNLAPRTPQVETQQGQGSSSLVRSGHSHHRFRTVLSGFYWQPSQLFLITKDADGFENEPIPLGANFLDAPAALDVIQLGVLKEAITRSLAGPGQISREQIQSVILARLEEMKDVVGGNLTDQRYRALVDGGRTAVRIAKGAA